MIDAQRDGRLPRGHKVQVPGTPSDGPRLWHNLTDLEVPRYPTSFQCESFALEEVVMDADPGAAAKRLNSSQGQMWANPGDR